MKENKLYTITVFSENTVGVLNQITTIFTRRQLNIESLSVSPSAIKGMHKFTITTFSNSESEMKRLVRQIDKRVDIMKAYFNTDEELVFQEIALYKVETQKFIATGNVEDIIRKYNVRILDISEHATILEKTGHNSETKKLFKELSKKMNILQFIRSGRVVITKSNIERLSDMLARREQEKIEEQENSIK